ncbi:MAG: response regulator [Pseudomonadota bacterium]|nr:response regulator [Pseudomonadota bacterium]
MSRLRAYVVEDSSVIRDNLTETLEENVPLHVVGTAEDEAAAVAWLHDPAHDCDLVIIDIFLRAGNGLGVLKSLAELGRPIERVVLSNHATPEMRAKCTELGADQVFDKSNQIEEMLSYFNRLASASGHSMPSSL